MLKKISKEDNKMKSFHDTITLYQEHIDGVFDASHTYHYPSHNVTPTIVTNRIIYINTAIERFDLLKNSIFLCDIDDPYEIITDGPEFMDRKNKRKQLIHKDKIRFLKTFPADLIKIIKDENTLLYIDHAIEGWRNVRLQDVASIFDIPVERLRWITSCFKFRKYETHPNGENIIYTNFFEKLMAGECDNTAFQIHQNFKIQIEHYKNGKKRHKLCTSYMRRRRPCRTMMAMLLNKYNLLDDMYWSLGYLVDGVNDPTTVHHNINRLEEYTKSISNNILTEDDFKWIRSIDKNITCDKHTLDHNLAFGEGSITWKHMFNTKFMLVHETIPGGLGGAEVKNTTPFLSEKAYKPFVTGQLFVLHGCVGTIQALREQGYDVFDDVVDHSYDSIEDGLDRARKICLVVEELSKKSDGEWEHLLRKLIPRFENNFNHLNSIRHNVIRATVEDPNARLKNSYPV